MMTTLTLWKWWRWWWAAVVIKTPAHVCPPSSPQHISLPEGFSISLPVRQRSHTSEGLQQSSVYCQIVCVFFPSFFWGGRRKGSRTVWFVVSPSKLDNQKSLIFHWRHKDAVLCMVFSSPHLRLQYFLFLIPPPPSSSSSSSPSYLLCFCDISLYVFGY